VAASLVESLGSIDAVGFLPPSLQALVVACTLRARRASVLWVTEDTESMERAEDDLLCFLEKGEVHVFPPYDVRPYQDDSPSKEILALRIDALRALAGRAPAVVVAPVSALACHTIAPADLKSRVIEVRPSDVLDRDEFASSLALMGYVREPLVEDVGQFSVRGSVVDVFSPGMESPVRIDLFGDEVSAVKAFDMRTQRTTKALPGATILPAGEIILDQAAIRRMRPALRRLAGEGAKPLIEDIEHGVHVPGLELFLPLFSDEPACLLDHLAPDATLFVPDDEDVSDAWDRVAEQYSHGHARAASQGRPLPHPQSVLVSKEGLLERMRRSHARVSTTRAFSPDTVRYRSASAYLQAGRGTDAVFDRVLSLITGLGGLYICSSAEMFTERVEYALTKRGVDVARARGGSILERQGPPTRVTVVPGSLSSGFVLEDLGIAVIGAEELLGAKRRRRRKPSGPPIYDPFTQLDVGDAVVHKDAGIGIFQGVVRLEVDGTSSDFVLLEYLGGDRLYVPMYRLNLLQRYVGDVDRFTVDKLGGTRWIHAKAKASQSVKRLAGELLEMYARRQAAQGFSYDTTNPLVEEFADAFPYTETDDQLKAVEETLSDMAGPRPMDRLICGDVGYGKTEVAMRAAFVAVMSGKQVAVLVPTTLLAHQHLRTFRERMEGWPIRVEVLSSMKGASRRDDVLQEIESGKVDIVIGTHALLSDRVKFKDLGLLVVDEEHRFGVRHKELIKARRAQVDVLTLTATPIPRTLNFAISGLRELSVIETPPAERKAVDTVISRYDEDAVAAAITRELDRGGQVFYVHNQVATIEEAAGRVQTLCPRARVGVAHGQMPRSKLEKVMSAFLDRKITVLVASAIISSGIDIPNANTIIIDRADKFGLADLYQLRGRVGRSKTKGYCLLLLPEVGQITKDARKRLAAVKEYESLGAGFHMALRDMEIRGVGDILGRAQWGHVTAIGFELYQEMLKEAVDRLKGVETRPKVEPEIHIGVDAYIPEDYCPDQHLRLGLYRRLFAASAHDLPSIVAELEDLYGPPPEPVTSLLVVSEIRDLMKRLEARKAEVHDGVLRLYVGHDSIVDLERLTSALARRGGRLRPEGVIEFPLDDARILEETREVLYELCQ